MPDATSGCDKESREIKKMKGFGTARKLFAPTNTPFTLATCQRVSEQTFSTATFQHLILSQIHQNFLWITHDGSAVQRWFQHIRTLSHWQFVEDVSQWHENTCFWRPAQGWAGRINPKYSLFIFNSSWEGTGYFRGTLKALPQLLSFVFIQYQWKIHCFVRYFNAHSKTKHL